MAVYTDPDLMPVLHKRDDPDTEAPRGILYHRYHIDEQGLILDAKIVPPTSQNQKTIENDLWKFVPKYVDLPLDRLTWQCEQAIRNYTTRASLARLIF